MRIHSLFALLLGLAASGSAFAQHETGADVFGGEQAFQSLCANCHGAAGNLIAGVDLGHGVFRQPYTDAQLQEIILKGIPGKAMPANPTMSTEQAVQIVAYLRSRGTQVDASANGDATRGAALFAGKGECLGCHRLNGEGSRMGPALDAIGALRTSVELTASLLDPDAVVQPNHRYYSVTTKSGDRINGRLMNQDVFSIQLLDDKEQLRSLQKADLQSHGFAPSPMPSLRSSFSEQEVADLVQYLVSLRGEQQ
ncbi:MAG: c-type cytochrome [Pseudomonadota bacterium]